MAYGPGVIKEHLHGRRTEGLAMGMEGCDPMSPDIEIDPAIAADGQGQTVGSARGINTYLVKDMDVVDADPFVVDTGIAAHHDPETNPRPMRGDVVAADMPFC